MNTHGAFKSLRTSSLVLALRNVGRMTGLNALLGRYLLGSGYEAKYDHSFASSLRPGDCVWDVGANVGYYTKLFAERVGTEGRVVAFEPSPFNFNRLTTACTLLRNVTLVNSGLGKADSKLRLQQGTDDLGATSRIVDGTSEGVVVDIRAGASLIERRDAPFPNAIKIDVEGFEYDVLTGLGVCIQQPELRLIGVEVHFGLLKARGVPQVPRQIEELLNREGFAVRWPDASHIIALRRP